MKKFLSILLSAVMVLSLAACGAKEATPNGPPAAIRRQMAATVSAMPRVSSWALRTSPAACSRSKNSL